jgi:hypothetical protein
MLLSFVLCCLVYGVVCCSVVFAFSTDDTLKKEKRVDRK